jgi:hypothetical protein
LQLRPWVPGHRDESENGSDEGYFDDDGIEYAQEEPHLHARGFQGPVQMADGCCAAHMTHHRKLNLFAGSFYDDSLHNSSSTSIEFPSLDSSNFPALPTSKPPNRSRQPEPQQQHGCKQPIVLEFANLPRSHKLQVTL